VTPVRELGQVLERRPAGAYQSLTLAAPRIAAAARPGQFVHLLAGEDRSFPLRRPFSVHRAAAPGGPGGTVEVVFEVVGAGTLALSRLRPGERVDALGPLGRPFTPPQEPAVCVLVGGGYGAAPLFFLAGELRARGCRVELVLGAATAARLLDPDEAGRLGDGLAVTTDDGSAGRRGLVTDPLPDLLARTGAGRVYACGPMPMLAAVSRVAATAGVPCQVAVEEQMACGTGICFSCVVPVGGSGGLKPSPPAHGGSGGPGGATRMARSCLEGPVFDGSAVAWAELGYPELEPAR
jgi:dihydroorotate dehydrogenase electron transfer subunit